MSHRVRILALCVVFSIAASAAEPAAEADLAKQLANPIANLISVPLQSNWDFGIGERDVSKYTLNVQPVIPFSIGEEWNLITRTIMPVINAPSPASGIDGASGFGDIVQSLFFSPKEGVGGWTVGAGPVLLWNTASDDVLGTGKWGAGPTGVALLQKGPWTYGALANHIWSFAGDDDRSPVNATFVNPFASYVTAKKTTFTVSPELTYDWQNDELLAPVNLIAAQLLKLGKQPVQLALGGRYYFDAPDGGPEWGIRFNIILLFPK